MGETMQSLYEKQAARRALKQAMANQVKGDAVNLDQTPYILADPKAEVNHLRQMVYLLQQRCRTLEGMIKQVFEVDVDEVLNLFVQHEETIKIILSEHDELKKQFEASMLRMNRILDMLNVRESFSTSVSASAKPVAVADSPDEVYEGEVPDEELQLPEEVVPTLKRPRQRA